MKKTVLVALFCLICCSLQAQVRFEMRSTEALRQMALREGKPVFIELYGSWCRICLEMQRKVFSRKDVGAFMNRNFVSAQYDVGSMVGKSLMRQYGDGSVPLYLIFDARGALLGRIEGGAAAEQFVEDLKRVLKHHNIERR